MLQIVIAQQRYNISCSHVSSGVAGMSDRERDQIDQDAEKFIRTCSTAIQSLKDEGLLTYVLQYASYPCGNLQISQDSNHECSQVQCLACS